MFKKVLEYTGEYRRTTYKAMVVLFLAVAVNALPYLFLYQLICPVLGYGEIDTVGIIWRVALIAVCVILYSVLYVKGLVFSHISAFNTLKNLRASLQGKLEKMPLGVIQEKGTGTIKKMFVEDIEALELVLAHAMPEGFANIAIPVIMVIGMFVVDWKLALLALLALPLGMLAMKMMYASGTGKMGEYYASAQKMNNTIVEYINGMEVVKVFNRDGESYERFETDIKSYRDFTLAWYKVCWPWMAVYNSVLPCIALFLLPVGAFFVMQGWSELPDLVLTLCMSFAIGTPLLRALSFVPTLPVVSYKIGQLEALMANEPLKQTDAPFSGKDHSISFENVRFAYEETEVLHGVSLDVKEGQLVALVGESGSGKSTLAKLLVHFYDVTGDCIKVGGQDIRKMSIEALNNEISYVSQEQFLFNMSLLENIRLGKPDATDDEVIAAAEKAQCGEFLARLEKGIHTMAGDGGKMLSGGERQRISLARAILKNAPIVVLDEATAFMDPENEEKMNRAIAEIIADKTVIVIAHRLHSIIGADKICVMKNGELVSADTHENLLKSCSEYQKLWQAAEGSASWNVSSSKEAKV
ncbi:MAG: ABC transporter ATP-binding protein [Oscillospiraceae bacterium]|nr:ABC transporter ATP-binding protein [Oscillospiraceae bacterium]